MKPEAFLKSWEDAVNQLERLRLEIIDKKDNKAVQRMILKLLALGEKISSGMGKSN